MAEQRQPFTLADIIADDAGKHLQYQRRDIRDSLDNADNNEHGYMNCGNKWKVQAVDHFQGNIHRQANTAKNRNPFWDTT